MKKNEIKKILVPVDFSKTSETAISNAMTLAKLLKAEVFLICVIENDWFHLSTILEMEIIQPLRLDIEKAIEKKLNEIQKKNSKIFDIVPEIYIATGNIHTEIIKFSEEKKINLIVMGTRGVSGYDEMFIGSNAQRVVALSETPVLTMQNNCNKSEFKNILIPIDNSTHSREKVNLAIIIAKLFCANIHIIGLYDSKDKQELNKFQTKLESVEKIFKSNKLPYKTSMVHGENLAKLAINYATENKCDLIIINIGHESNIADNFLGAFAQQIVNHSKIPVLSIKHTRGHYSNSAAGFPGF